MSSKDRLPVIKVIGVGAAGKNAVNYMVDSGLEGVEFISTDTISPLFEISKAPVKLKMGKTDVCGNPQTGGQGTLEDVKMIRNALRGSHMVFITAGLGGNTGTGASPVIDKICKEMGALTVAVVTTPFSFESKNWIKRSEKGIHALQKVADVVIVIPNDRLEVFKSKKIKKAELFRKSDDFLFHSVKCITDLILIPGLVGIDFADIKTVFSNSGITRVGTGRANGKNRAITAVKKAVSHPMIEDISLAQAQSVIMNITADTRITLEEMTQAADFMYQEAGNAPDVIWSTIIDEDLDDCFNVTIVAAGYLSVPESFSIMRSTC